MTASLALPAWARVTDKRLAHIARVTALLDDWAAAMSLAPAEARAWHDAGLWHDALRDADEAELRRWGGSDRPIQTVHGPAAAARLAHEGEAREDVLEAIRWHTLGHPRWARTGRALYMADFLEPGRSFLREERARLAARVPQEFDTVFRDVVRQRLEWTLREGKTLYPETAELWNHVR